MTNDPSSSTPLPPGMVLGPDGKPCKACTAFRNWKSMPIPDKSSSSSSVSSAITTPRPVEPPKDCPPDSEQLGRATWTFLHTTAAYYPEKPSLTQRANMLALLRSLPLLYPCAPCANDFGEDLKVNPPDVSGRAGLSLWLCQRHNEVNTKLGKVAFDCSKTSERWKDGPKDGSCD
ncbi:ERV/ALR sulfhydryl oxidase domain-containing protein [Flagelloscypha sp. PMI_526]|nr:ERV/ALR sulfhydryl oxidase domain-containing protein [Flagelloscypha sp. PMI_526]